MGKITHFVSHTGETLGGAIDTTDIQYSQILSTIGTLLTTLRSTRPETKPRLQVLLPSMFLGTYADVAPGSHVVLEENREYVLDNGTPVVLYFTTLPSVQDRFVAVWERQSSADIGLWANTTDVSIPENGVVETPVQSDGLTTGDYKHLEAIARGIKALKGKLSFDTLEGYLYVHSVPPELKPVFERAGWVYGHISHDQGIVRDVWMIPASEDAV